MNGSQTIPTVAEIVAKTYTGAEMQQVQFGAFAAGIFVTLLLMATLWLVWKVWNEKPEPTPQPLPDRRRALSQKVNADKIATLLIVGVFLLSNVAISYAQTSTPVPPTATPIATLDIPINTIMIGTNSWLATFAPIAAIGIGISIALAVLGYLGKMIKSAFT